MRGNVMGDDRNLELKPRAENTRDKKAIKVENFDLLQIKNHFDENLNSLRKHFNLADELVSKNKDEDAKDIWRTQIVFLESALDFYFHEITKYGMNKIFNNDWPQTDKYKNYNLRLEDVLYVIKNPEETSWFLEHVNQMIMHETFMSYDKIKTQLNLLGIDINDIANRAFYAKGSTEKPNDKLRNSINRLFERRNQIVHQSDRDHFDGTKNDIQKEYVENAIDIIQKIVNAINGYIEDKEVN